jgi:molybdate transport system substrate-binding protein
MFRRVRLTALLLGAVLLASVSTARAQLTVAAASDLQTVMPEMAERFRVASGQTLRIAYGSSGQFVSQIQNGAPFDVLLSADLDYVRQLVASGHADADTVLPYANGRLAIWARHDRQIDVSRGLAALTDPRVRRIAIANPAHAPYGRAAVSALQHAALYDSLRGRLVLGENIAQAAQFVESGSADVGLIALSLAISPALRAVGAYVEVPADAYPPIRQGAVVVARSANKANARQFLAFLASRDSVALLQSFGFGAAQ